MQHYIRRAIAPTTRCTYDSVERSYRDFAASVSVSLRDAPIRADVVCEYLAQMADRGQHNASTIAVHKSALHTIAEEQAHIAAPNPLDAPKVKRLLAGIAADRAALEQSRRAANPQNAPLTLDLVRALRPRYEGSQHGRMLYALVALAVAGCSRLSELLGSAKYPERRLRTRQIAFYADAEGRVAVEPASGSRADTPHHLELRLDITKTDQGRRGTVKVISAQTAVEAVWRHLCDGGQRSDDAVFGKVSTTALVRSVREELTAIGRADIAAQTGGRSFRRGAASTLSAMGADDADIAALGWAPNSTVGRSHYANDPGVQRARALAINAQMERAVGAARSL